MYERLWKKIMQMFAGIQHVVGSFIWMAFLYGCAYFCPSGMYLVAFFGPWVNISFNVIYAFDYHRHKFYHPQPVVKCTSGVSIYVVSDPCSNGSSSATKSSDTANTLLCTCLTPKPRSHQDSKSFGKKMKTKIENFGGDLGPCSFPCLWPVL